MFSCSACIKQSPAAWILRPFYVLRRELFSPYFEEISARLILLISCFYSFASFRKLFIFPPSPLEPFLSGVVIKCISFTLRFCAFCRTPPPFLCLCVEKVLSNSNLSPKFCSSNSRATVGSLYHYKFDCRLFFFFVLCLRWPGDQLLFFSTSPLPCSHPLVFCRLTSPDKHTF